MEKDIDFESTNTQLTNHKSYQAQIVWTLVVALSLGLMAFYHLARTLPPQKTIPTIQVVQSQPVEVGLNRAIAAENPEPIPIQPIEVLPQ